MLATLAGCGGACSLLAVPAPGAGRVVEDALASG